MRDRCRICGEKYTPADLIAAEGVAFCHGCGSAFEVRLPAADGGQSPEVARPPVPLPERFELDDAGDGLRLTRRWLCKHLKNVVPVAVYACVGVGFVVTEHTAGGAGSGGGHGPLYYGAVAFFGLVGLALVYLTVRRLVNRTTVRVAAGAIRRRHHPLPPWGATTVRAGELDELFVKPTAYAALHGGPSTWKIEALLAGARIARLVEDLESREQALYLKRRFERALAAGAA